MKVVKKSKWNKISKVVNKLDSIVDLYFKEKLSDFLIKKKKKAIIWRYRSCWWINFYSPHSRLNSCYLPCVFDKTVLFCVNTVKINNNLSNSSQVHTLNLSESTPGNLGFCLSWIMGRATQSIMGISPAGREKNPRLWIRFISLTAKTTLWATSQFSHCVIVVEGLQTKHLMIEHSRNSNIRA